MKTEKYFKSKTNQRKSSSKKLSKYVAVFDYIDKISIVLSATTGRVFIIFFTTVIGATAEITSARFSFYFLELQE